MKIKRFLPALFLLIALVFEFLPQGVVLFFANPEGEPYRRTFSFFSMIPYGYGTVGPFLAAFFTAVAFLLALILFFKPKKAILISVRSLSFISALLALTPVFAGASSLGYVGLSIVLVLVGAFTSTFFSRDHRKS